MQKYLRLGGAMAVAVVVAATLAVTAPASAAPVTHGSIPTAVPSDRTPQVLDQRVIDLEQVGNRIVVAGSFTQVRDAAANGGAAFAQPSVFAFDATTGRIDRAFAPAVNGVVNAVLAGPNGTVYLGGSFSTVNGTTARNLVQVSVATGARVGAFAPSGINGAVFDLASSGSRLFVAGTFTSVAGAPHGGLAAVAATTGAVDEYLGVDVTENHNWTQGSQGARGAVGVRDLAVSPDGSRLIAIGNFQRADGLLRDQVVSVLLQPGGAVVDPDWRTRRYEAPCFSWAYDFYVREVDFSPDGSYFVVVTTGGNNTGTLCDTAARWEVADTGDDVQPRWSADAGGDTLHSVAVTDVAVYVGGHQRWMNNVLGNDSPGPGAVPRPGLAALDPRTGIPLTWNPGRNPRGIGAEALLATPAGLYVGSDTEAIGNWSYVRPRLAYFPLAGGTAPPSEDTRALPATMFLGGRAATLPSGGGTGEVLHRVNAGGPALAALDGGPDWAADDGSRHTPANGAGWAPVPAVDGSVPPSTPSQIFDTELWDPGDAPELSWQFPVAAGTTVEVRLYFANRCTCTSAPGQRAFDVSVEGQVVLDDYDIVGDVGDQTGTMKSFVVTSDGTVNIDFGHVVENPLVNGIEIVASTGAPTPVEAGVDDVLSRWFDGATAGPDTAVGSGGLQWSKVRGAFMAGNTLFYGYPTDAGPYTLYRRTFDGSAFGPATAIDPYNDPYWSDVDTKSGQTYRGTRPVFYSQLSSVSGMFFSDGRLYYTRTGSAALFMRFFSVDSGVVGADEFQVAASGFGDVAGLFRSGEQLYWGSRSTGELRRAAWSGGELTAAPVTVDGPSTGGRNWSTRALFPGPGEGPPAPNRAPVAEFDHVCTGLTCRFDGGPSTDGDGEVTDWSWDMGDGSATAGRVITHAFDAPGSYPVTLTVTDDDGATAVATQTVLVEAPPAGTGIALRGSAGTTARPVTTVSVAVPEAVQAGDGLLLIFSVNTGQQAAAPAGWSSVRTQTDSGKVTTQVFSRVATASDAGAAVTVGVGEVAAVSLQLLAYSGTDRTDPVAASAGAATGAGAAHTTPTAQAPSGAMVVSVWSDKGPSARQFTAPATVTERSNLAGVGNGDVATLVGDSETPVPAGQVGGLTATVSAASARSVALTVVLAPGGGAPPGNQAPDAVISSTCTELACDFDSAGSSDPDGSVQSVAWTFGDGQTSSEPAPRHRYAAAGDYTVTLTVTDSGGSTDVATATVTVAAAPTGSGIGLRGSAGTSARPVLSAAVEVPASVRAGDGLVLVLSTNSAVTGSTPAGWTLAATQTDAGRMTTQVFTRVAAAGDPGTSVTTSFAERSAVTLQLMAYSGTSASGPVASVVGAAGGPGTSHTTPTATAPAGAWVLSIWSDKSPTARQFLPPAQLAERSNLAATGNGDVATLVADSGGPVAGGIVGGLTATVPTPSSRSTVLTVVLAR